jgi:hypothetical protein
MDPGSALCWSQLSFPTLSARSVESASFPPRCSFEKTSGVVMWQHPVQANPDGAFWLRRTFQFETHHLEDCEVPHAIRRPDIVLIKVAR